MPIDWPTGFERTDPGHRKGSSPYQTTLGQTTGEIEDEMRLLGVDQWKASTGSGGSYTKSSGLPKHDANPDDPGFVLRWTKNGTDYAVACDRFRSLRDNVRTVYLWINETRMRSQRPVETGEDEFAAARLPPGDPEREKVVGRQPPHEVLGVQPNADPDAVKAAARRLQRKYHPDTGEQPDKDMFQRVTKARKAMAEQ